MKLLVMSDLHLDYPSNMQRFLQGLTVFKKKHGDDGTLILAGDILQMDPRLVSDGSAKALYTGLASEFKGGCIYLPGNHDAWDSSIAETDLIFKQWEEEIPNFNYLRPGVAFVLGGQVYRGGTLWHDGCHQKYLETAMPDFEAITDMDKAYEHNADFVEDVCRYIEENDIVISHHLPSSRSTPDRFINSPLNPFFVSDQEYWIRMKQPKLWIHGHGHDPVNYNIGNTKIYSNPFGYYRENTNPNFWDRIVLESN